MASSLPSFEAFGSPQNPDNSVIHLCMSVNRTVSGSVPGYLSVSAMAMSSVSSQPKVAGMLLLTDQNQDWTSTTEAMDKIENRLARLMIKFFGVILVPLGNFHNDVCGAIGYGLATQSRFRRDARRFIEFVELRIGGLIAGFQAFPHDHVAGRAGAHASARVVQSRFNALGNIKNASGQAVMAVGDLFRIDLDGLAAGKKCHLIFLRGRLVFDFFNIGVAAAHLFLLPTISKSS